MNAPARPLPAPFSDGPFSVTEAAASGIARSRLRAKDLAAPFVGVRSIGSDQPTPLELARAYLPIMAPAEFFSHVTAALIHGIWVPLGLEQCLRLDVSVHKPARAPRDHLVRGHHLIPRDGLVVEKDGFRVASPVETWCQLANVLSTAQLAVAGDALVQHGVQGASVIRGEILAAADDAARPMSGRLRTASRLVRTGSRSAGESGLRVLLVAAGLPDPEVNGRILDGLGRFVAECDLVYRPARVVVEYEGDGHRTDRATFRNDIHRYERLQDLGWRVVRVTADDVRLRPAETIARVRRLLGL